MWETTEPNKWLSRCAHHLFLWLHASQALFKSGAHRAKRSGRSEGVRRTFPVGDNTELNEWLVNQRRALMKGKRVRNHSDVQRSGGLWLPSLLWIANKWAVTEKIRRNRAEDRISHWPAVFTQFYFTIGVADAEHEIKWNKATAHAKEII